MARRLITTDRLIAGLAVVVLLLGVVVFWTTTHGWKLAAEEPSPSERALGQLRQLLGPDAEIQYLEAGKGRVVCGYVGVHDGSGGAAFISRPNRLMLSTDPLRKEFEEMLPTVCPGFLQAPPAKP